MRLPLVPAALAAILMTLLSLAGCSKPPEKPDPVRPAKVMSVRPATGEDVMLFAGEVRPRYEIDLSFRIGGKLLERKVDMGAQVTKGQPLARLDPQDARLSAAAATAQVAAVQADLAFAKAEMDRNRQLLDQKFISQAAYDNKLAAYQAALARRDAAKAQSDVSGNQAGYTTLVADTPGIVTAVLVEAGQVLTAGQAVMKLARTEERDVVISVAENQASALKVGAPARISLWSQPQKIYNGRVREVAPAADALTRTYLVKIAVQDADAGLRWGMTANVGVTGMRGNALAAGAIVVPLTAINQQGQQAAVWIVGPGNAVQPRPVVIAQYVENGAVVIAGLNVGETIVVAGVHKLNAGDVIRPLPEQGVAPGTVAPSTFQIAAPTPASTSQLPTPAIQTVPPVLADAAGMPKAQAPLATAAAPMPGQ
ncbi:MAG: efflux RND transporter periplasmic adaptor subunit [Betaproteobacteria bacterium]